MGVVLNLLNKQTLNFIPYNPLFASNCWLFPARFTLFHAGNKLFHARFTLFHAGNKPFHARFNLFHARNKLFHAHFNVFHVVNKPFHARSNLFHAGNKHFPAANFSLKAIICIINTLLFVRFSKKLWVKTYCLHSVKYYIYFKYILI